MRQSASFSNASTPNRVSGPVQFVLKLLESWRLSRDEAVFLLGFDQKDNGSVQAVLAGVADLHGTAETFAIELPIFSTSGRSCHRSFAIWMSKTNGCANLTPCGMSKSR